jgi:hypothetical protein
MTNPSTVASIYTCLEMLRIDRPDLHEWWCNFLYKANGDVHYPAWNEHKLAVMENDLIYNI